MATDKAALALYWDYSKFQWVLETQIRSPKGWRVATQRRASLEGSLKAVALRAIKDFVEYDLTVFRVPSNQMLAREQQA